MRVICIVGSISFVCCMGKGPATTHLFPSHQVIVLLSSFHYILTIPNLPSTLNISPDPWERIRPKCFHSVGLWPLHPLLRISVFVLSFRILLWWLLLMQWPTLPNWNRPLCIITYSKAPAVSTTTGIQNRQLLLTPTAERVGPKIPMRTDYSLHP